MRVKSIKIITAVVLVLGLWSLSAHKIQAVTYFECYYDCLGQDGSVEHVNQCKQSCDYLNQKPSNESSDVIKITSEADSGPKPIKLNVPIGGLTEINIDDTSFGTYLQNWYTFIIGSIGVIATVMMMWGGFKWLTSRGNSGTISDAKQIIWSALTGVVLAFLSYSILYFINPATTSIGLPKVTSHYNEVNIAEMQFHEDEHHDHIPDLPGDSGPGAGSGELGDKREQLTSSGITIHTGDDRIVGLDNQTITNVIALNESLPGQNMRLTSGYRPNTGDTHSHHANGDTIDMDDGADVDPTMESIISTYQVDSYVDSDLGFPIYELGENQWGITRIIDERTRDASHWHVEF